MTEYLDPINRVTFDRIFGKNPDILKDFLNALMPFEEGREIVRIRFNNIPWYTPVQENAIVIVFCTDNYGNRFYVQMMMYCNNFFYYRLAFDASMAYVGKLGYDEYDNKYHKQVYILGIVNDVFDKDTTEYYHHYKTFYQKNLTDVINGLEAVMIELPKFKPTTGTKKKMRILWLRFLTEIKGNKYIEPAEELMENEYIRKAINFCERSKYSWKECRLYDDYRDDIKRERIYRDAEVAELREEMIITIFKSGISVDFISAITKIPKDEINSVLKRRRQLSSE